MDALNTTKRLLGSKQGQTLIELTLIVPLMVALLFGAVEVGSVISAYLTITHTTREGANLTSRGAVPDAALDAVILAAAPTMTSTNQAQWRVIYSKITPQPPPAACPPKPCHYRVESQIVKGNFAQNSKIGLPNGSDIIINGIADVDPLQTFHGIEVYYDYTPNVMTYVGKNLLNKTFYERTIFTDVH